MGRYTEALSWYSACHSVKPGDATTHAHIGFTLHLLQRYRDLSFFITCTRFDEAIDEYHKALAICPTLNVCAEMLDKVMQDKLSYDRTSSSTQQCTK